MAAVQAITDQLVLTPDNQHTGHRSLRSRRRTHFSRAAIVGLVVGLLAVAFRNCLSLSEAGRRSLLTGLHAHPLWGWIVLPIIGLAAGSAVGWCTQRFAPQAAGSGIPHLKGVLLHLRTLNWPRLIPVKFVGGVVGIGAGFSLGREGPTVQMGSAIARAIAGPLRAPASDIPQLLSAGAGAGLAAAFNAPLAGMIFVVEELHRELSSRTAAGALVAAVCATVVAQSLAGDAPAFEVHGLSAMPLPMLPLAAVIGLLGGAAGVLFNRALLAAQHAAVSQKRMPLWFLAGIVGALVGITAWWLPDAVGTGHAVSERVLGESLTMSLGLLTILLLTKFVLTVFSYASGIPGGVFAPMLLLGALCGAAFARAAALALPAVASETQILAVLGMAAFFVSSVRAPLTGIVLISEMTGGYQVLFPICIAALAAYLVAEAVRDRPLYDALLEADLDRTGHGPTRPEPRSMYIGVQAGSALAGVPISKAGLPAGCLIVAVERAGANVLPTAGTTLLPGDHISVLTPGESPESPLEIVRLCTGL